MSKSRFKTLAIISLIVALRKPPCEAANSSWQLMVDIKLIDKGLRGGAIASFDGNVRATSRGFSPRPGEIHKIIEGFKNPAEIVRAGVTIGDKHYVTVKADARRIDGKAGTEGAVIVKTGKNLVIGVYDDTINPANASAVVEKLGDYLIAGGY